MAEQGIDSAEQGILLRHQRNADISESPRIERGRIHRDPSGRFPAIQRKKLHGSGFCALQGFAIVEADATHSLRLRFLGIPFGEPVDAMRVIYEHHWRGLGEIGERRLRPVTRD